MEAHVGTVRIPVGAAAKSRRGLRQFLRELSASRREHAIRTRHARIRSIPGSEHSHMMPPPKAY